ncbi:hypothetical protein LINPERPRIM_LOCUS30618 [Linum perenne]
MKQTPLPICFHNKKILHPSSHQTPTATAPVPEIEIGGGHLFPIAGIDDDQSSTPIPFET